MDLKSQSFNSSDHNLSLSPSPKIHLQQRIDLIYQTQQKKNGNQPKSLNCKYSFNSVFIQNCFLLHHSSRKKISISAYLPLSSLNLQNLFSPKRPPKDLPSPPPEKSLKNISATRKLPTEASVLTVRPPYRSLPFRSFRSLAPSPLIINRRRFLHTTHTKRNKNSMHPMQD
jgi:hypothetical protein